jgi:hypothetical protein
MTKWTVLLGLCLLSCGDDPKPIGEFCDENEECKSNHCEQQTDGTKKCATAPTSGAAAGGW